MKTMIWKEVRENLKWALLALVGLGGAEFYALTSSSRPSGPIPLMESSFLMATSWGCVACGLLLALLQILPELRRDRWAALLHRPVSRDPIFFGKVVAGIGLYLLATIPPFLVSVWYVKTPGHFPMVFNPGFMIPGAMNIAGGLAFYSAGLYAGFKPGRWYGTRLLVVFAAIILAVVSALIGNIPEKLLIWAVAFVAFGSAAHGAMRTNGTFRGQPLLAKLSAAAIAAVGVFLLEALLVVGVLGPLWDRLKSSPGPAEHREYGVLEDGRPVLFRTRGPQTQCEDLNGAPITDSRFLPCSRHLLRFGDIPNDWEGTRERASTLEDEYVRELRETSIRGERWFYMRKERIIVGYVVEQTFPRTVVRCIGSIGADGFHPGQPLAQPFPSAIVDHRRLLQIGHKVLLFDSAHRRLQTLLDAGASSIHGIGEIQLQAPHGQKPDPIYALALDQKVVVVDSKGGLLATLPYRHELHPFSELAIGRVADGSRYLLKYTPSSWIARPERDQLPEWLETSDPQGNSLNSSLLPPVRNPRPQPDLIDKSLIGLMPSVFFGGYFSLLKIGMLLGSDEMAKQWASTDWAATRQFAMAIMTESILFACLVLAWARARRFPWNSAIRWALFVLGFNLVGLIAFRLSEDWPVEVQCPKCSSPRDRSGATCPHCQGEWPSPGRDGTEITEEPSRELAVL
jgi:hypothetical protein